MKPRPTHEKNLEAIIGIATGFVVLFYAFKAKYLLTIALLILLIGLFSKPLTRWVAFVWIEFSEVLGKVTSRIILFAVFYLFLTPLALFRKLVGGKKQISLKTSYTELNKTYTPKDLENTW